MLDVGKLNTVTVDFKKISGVESKEVVKTTVYNKLKTKVNNLEGKIPDTTNLIQANQYNTDKQNLEIKVADVGKKYLTFDKKILDVTGLVNTTTVLNTKITVVENKMPRVSNLVK